MIGELISLGTSLLGASADKKAAKRAAEEQRAADERNAALQREFAQNSIQWKTADAKAAGIHPVYAMGAQVSPASASFTASPVHSSGDSWRAAGAGLARAASAGQTASQRLGDRLLESQIEGQEIDNAYKRSQLALQSGSQVPPPFPDGAYDGGVTPMYSKVRTPSGDRTMVSPAYGQVLENDLTEYLRYIPRDFYSRAKRLGKSMWDYADRLYEPARR